MNARAQAFGPSLSEAWERDPQRFAFTFSRYKFVARMLSGMSDVLEVGAGDGVASEIVRQHVRGLLLTDKVPQGLRVLGADLTLGKLAVAPLNAVYALDVLEHIAPEREAAFMTNICAALKPTGTLIIGMPSLESQRYASEPSLREHVNCKTEVELRQTMSKYFHCVYLFGMNDETLHTGYGPMCHYRLAIANTKRKEEIK